MIIILMGVTGCGKTTIGRQLAQELNWPFYDADDFHPAANVEKMRAGIPLTDEDREPWLLTLQNLIREKLNAGQSGVLACSALKQKYRDCLRVDPVQVRFVFLRGDFDTIARRLAARTNHYMNPNLLASQFEALEEPADARAVDIAQPPAAIVARILSELQLRQPNT
ncbi:MAG: gluconokinase [candidate division KSB1 bacterium]|nr:gluconokinase [candidate division KSB1 bacterium]MDZ7273560.1 gluconokinase [candidate division KSB1 bacterium]MDZ7286849.1 gluconokinase [candidate division KSB1 bacterium]MDZ7299794.1 gluconokinase [candidate division KSB1 bacterium]MDZ7308655.1 gluconokinase [candidate division KSB1 bacterium]